MNRRLLPAILFFIPVALLSSCSGVKQVINCACVNTNGTVSLVLTATPPNPNSQLSIQAFTATITGVTLTSTGGANVPLQLNSSTYIAEFNRVTSDSTILADGASIAADTYNAVKISFANPRVTFCTQTTPGVPGCAAGTLTSVSGLAGSATATISLTLAVNQKAGFAINVNLANALTLNGQNITTVALGATNVFSATALLPASTATDLAAGELSHIDDVMGTITAINSNVITLQTTTRGSITASANSSTQFDTSCASPSVTGCVHVNDVAIIDAVLNSDSTFTLAYYQPLFAVSTDVIEGVVTGVPDSVNNKVTVAVTDSVFANNASVLNGQLHIGDQVTVTLAAPQPFTIISKALTVPANSFNNSTSISNLQPGQSVALPATAFVAQSGVTPGTTTTNTFLLRFSRISGITTAAGSPTFSANTLPPFFGLANNQQLQTTSSRLSLDGISTLASLTVGSAFSSSALYLGTPASPIFAAQTVRAH